MRLRVVDWVRRNKGSLALLVLAPAVPELLTGNTPFWRFLNPLGFIPLLVVYGFPALVIRDLTLGRYHRTLVLGMVEGVFIEGMVANTFYTDRGIGVFSSYGRFMGVNWAWALYLIFFHSIFSVLAPVMVSDSLFPRGRVLSRSSMAILLAASAGMAVVSNMSPEVYRPDPRFWALSLALLALILLIYRLIDDRSLFTERLVFPSCLLFAPVFLILAFFGLAGHVHPAVQMIIGLVLYSSLYNKVRTCEDAWSTSRDLLLGFSITGFIVAVLSSKPYIAPPAIFFLALFLILDRKRRAFGDEQPGGDERGAVEVFA